MASSPDTPSAPGSSGTTGATAPRPAGGPVLQDSVTAAISQAFFEELAATGYAKLSLEAVARRAGAGKAAIYRRWPAKQEMALALISDVVARTPEPLDSGAVREDLLAFLAETAEVLRHPLASKIIPDLLAEARRTPELGEALLGAVREPRRSRAGRILDRAVERGELPADLDHGIALDLLAGPLYWHIAVVNGTAEPGYLERLADMLLAALRG
ncbi:TetR-like C-terminal domain-containing protein [Kitasatospora sp. NPDC006697]|uniref:TetR-like C-terminal domain-containing protein n=1 Tax=Kitasatospora sp. NPDC006697 TaxID=3364020 RepID=UPI0036949F82